MCVRSGVCVENERPGLMAGWVMDGCWCGAAVERQWSGVERVVELMESSS